MKFWSAERVASLAIGILLLVLARSLGEYFRLKHVHGQGLTIANVEPFVIGSLGAAISVGLAFTLYVMRKYRTAVVVCAVAVIGLLIYKILAIA